MSNAIFPTLPGLAWSVTKTPNWKTGIQQAVSGKEVRIAYQSRPKWAFTLSYEVLRGYQPLAEYQQLVAFFNQRMGAYDSFLYQDPNDNSVSGQSFGSGDGTTKAFQLLHSIGGWLEPIGYTSAPAVYVSGVLQYGYARTNWLRNNTMGGAVAGSPGTVPTNWSTGLSGLASSVVGTGVENGINYIDIRVFGSPTSTSSGIRFETTSGVPAASGQTWAGSFYVRKVAGSNTGINTILSNIRGYTTGGVATTDDYNGTSVLTAIGVTDISQNRASVVHALADATTTYLRPQLFMNHTVGAAVDITLRIGMPQLERDTAPTPPIATSSGAGTVTDYSTDGLSVTFAAAPANGAALTWSGQFYYRVRFKQDMLDFEQFMQDFWLLKKCELVGVL